MPPVSVADSGHPIRGPLVEFSRSIGIPYCRLRAAIPESLLRGSLAAALGLSGPLSARSLADAQLSSVMRRERIPPVELNTSPGGSQAGGGVPERRLQRRASGVSSKRGKPRPSASKAAEAAAAAGANGGGAAPSQLAYQQQPLLTPRGGNPAPPLLVGGDEQQGESGGAAAEATSAPKTPRASKSEKGGRPPRVSSAGGRDRSALVGAEDVAVSLPTTPRGGGGGSGGGAEPQQLKRRPSLTVLIPPAAGGGLSSGPRRLSTTSGGPYGRVPSAPRLLQADSGATAASAAASKPPRTPRVSAATATAAAAAAPASPAAAQQAVLWTLTDGEWVVSTALAHAFLRAGRLLPLPEAAQKQRRASEFFGALTAGDSPDQGLGFDALVDHFEALISGAAGLGGESEWWGRARLWRLYLTARRRPFFPSPAADDTDDRRASNAAAATSGAEATSTMCFWDPTDDLAVALQAVPAGGGGSAPNTPAAAAGGGAAAYFEAVAGISPAGAGELLDAACPVSQASASAVLRSVPACLWLLPAVAVGAEPVERAWATLLAVALLRRLPSHLLLCEPVSPQDAGTTLLDASLAYVRTLHRGEGRAKAAAAEAARAAEAQVEQWDRRHALVAARLRDAVAHEAGGASSSGVGAAVSAILSRAALFGCVLAFSDERPIHHVVTR